MSDGLSIDLSEFRKLPTNQQRGVLFQNTEQIKTLIAGFKFHQKVQYILISLLFLLVGGKIYLGGLL